MTRPSAVAAVIPALNEDASVAATVSAVRAIPAVRFVVVVDDGSQDMTLRRAGDAGAIVVRHPHRRGKAAALTSGVARVDRFAGAEELALLFVDADLGSTAANVAPLCEPVLTGEADMTIATLPPQTTAGGGRGLVVSLARNGIREATGWEATQPLSGMRCLTREVFTAASPLAAGWGVETALTIDALTAGFTLLEVPCDLQHRVSGSDWRGQVHRAEQYADVAKALTMRRARRVAPLRLLNRLPRLRSR